MNLQYQLSCHTLWGKGKAERTIMTRSIFDYLWCCTWSFLTVLVHIESEYWWIDEIVIIMCAFSTVSFSVGFLLLLLLLLLFFLYSLTFSLYLFHAMNPDLSLGCRARRDSSWELSKMGVKVAWLGEVSLWEYKPKGKLAGWFEDGGESLRGVRILYLRKQFMYQNVHINCSRSSIQQIFAPTSFYPPPPPPLPTHTYTRRAKSALEVKFVIFRSYKIVLKPLSLDRLISDIISLRLVEHIYTTPFGY